MILQRNSEKNEDRRINEESSAYKRNVAIFVINTYRYIPTGIQTHTHILVLTCTYVHTYAHSNAHTDTQQ